MMRRQASSIGAAARAASRSTGAASPCGRSTSSPLARSSPARTVAPSGPRARSRRRGRRPAECAVVAAAAALWGGRQAIGRRAVVPLRGALARCTAMRGAALAARCRSSARSIAALSARVASSCALSASTRACIPTTPSPPLPPRLRAPHHRRYRYLAEHGVDVPSLQARIKDICIKTLISVEHSVVSKCYERCHGKASCFEVFGFDVLLDKSP